MSVFVIACSELMRAVGNPIVAAFLDKDAPESAAILNQLTDLLKKIVKQSGAEDLVNPAEEELENSTEVKRARVAST